MKETGSGGIRWNNLVNTWNKIINKYPNNNLVILCARSHGKTTNFSIMETIYQGVIHKNYQQVVISGGERQASLIVRDIRTVIENNEYLRKLVDWKHWSTEFLGFNGGFIISRGIGAEIRGIHPNRFVLDDILRSDEKFSKDKIEAYVFEDVVPAAAPKKAQIVIVGTKKDSTDIFTIIEMMIKEGATKWKFYKFPGILDEKTKKVLAEDIHTYDDLMEMKKTMGTLKFNKEIMLEPLAEGSRIFPEELLELAKDLDLSYEKIPEKGALYYAGADLARSGSVSADSTGCIFIKFDEQFQINKIVEFYHKKGIKIRTQVKDIALICNKFNNAILLAEENNFGRDFIDLMIDEYNVTIESIKTTDRSKEDNVRRLLVALENEKLKFPYYTLYDRKRTEKILNELRHYIIKKTPAGNEKMESSGGYHDDLVDSLCIALRCAQTTGGEPKDLPGGRGTELEHMLKLNMIPEKEGDLGFELPPILF